MAKTSASGYIIDAVEAAASAMTHIEEQMGELDGPALDAISQSFVSSLKVFATRRGPAPKPVAKPSPPCVPRPRTRSCGKR